MVSVVLIFYCVRVSGYVLLCTAGALVPVVSVVLICDCVFVLSYVDLILTTSTCEPMVLSIISGNGILVHVIKCGINYEAAYGAFFILTFLCRTGGRMRYNTVVLGTAVVGADVPVTGLVACPLI